VRENRTHGLKGGWGNGSAQRTPRPRLPMGGRLITNDGMGGLKIQNTRRKFYPSTA